MSSWCDKLASTPAIGFKFDAHYIGLDSTIRALSPMLDSWVQGDRQEFDLEQIDAFNCNINHHSGFVYGIGTQKMSVEFKYRLRAKSVSGAPPTVEITSTPRPYSQLIPECAKRLIRTVSLLTADHPRKVERAGVTSTTFVSTNDAPPGIKRFLEYIGRPWRAELEEFSIVMIAPIATGRGYTDRCVHTIGRAQAGERLLTMQFDWQRLFSTPRSMTVDAMGTLADDMQKEALKYFEDLAEGNRFDEELLSAAARA
jgi:hypothetical protein